MKKLKTSMLLFLICLTGMAQEDNDVLYIFPSKEVYETGHRRLRSIRLSNLHVQYLKKQIISPVACSIC